MFPKHLSHAAHLAKDVLEPTISALSSTPSWVGELFFSLSAKLAPGQNIMFWPAAGQMMKAIAGVCNLLTPMLKHMVIQMKSIDGRTIIPDIIRLWDSPPKIQSFGQHFKRFRPIHG